MAKKICCPKCKSEELQFIPYRKKNERKDGLLITAIVLLCISVVIIFYGVQAMAEIANANAEELLSSKALIMQIKPIIIMLIGLFFTIIGCIPLFFWSKPGLTEKTKYICSFCGHSDLLEKLTAPKKKYDYDEDEDAE